MNKTSKPLRWLLLLPLATTLKSLETSLQTLCNKAGRCRFDIPSNITEFDFASRVIDGAGCVSTDATMLTDETTTVFARSPPHNSTLASAACLGSCGDIGWKDRVQNCFTNCVEPKDSPQIVRSCKDREKEK